jgi:CheY-like chemotaxis protein
MHALIIEDQLSIAMLIEEPLREIGCTSIDFALTEAEAIASAERHCPDIITSDIRLAHGCGKGSHIVGLR